MTLLVAVLWDGRDLPGYSACRYSVDDADAMFRGARAWAEMEGMPLTCVLVAGDSFLKDAKRLEPDAWVEPMGYGHCGGWSPMMEAYQPALWPTEDQRTIAVGIDTMFVGPWSWLATWDEAPVGLPPDPFSAPKACNAVTSCSRDGCAELWDEYMRERDRGMPRDRLQGRPSEMMLMRRLQQERGWALLDPNHERLLSYKCHVRKGANTSRASVVYFHGSPKPQDLTAEEHATLCRS